MMDPASIPHRRQNLLTGAWVLVSPHRMGRPWQGDAAPPDEDFAPSHDPSCYLCPGNVRVGGVQNPDYQGVWVFDNDFPALLPPEPGPVADPDPLLVSAPEIGTCRVICYSPDHAKTMAKMSVDEVKAVVEVWTAQWEELSVRPDLGAVTIFENRGAMMGASNPHPHGQIWATSSVPHELATEVTQQAAWFQAHQSPLLIDYLARELEADARIILKNDSFVVLVPFWAAWPFETLVLPRRAVGDLSVLTDRERADLADVLSRLTKAYDQLFATAFPYTMGLHQRPTRLPAPGFVFHMHFYPPLLRSASVRKHMVGFEMLGMAQRDLTPEAAAERLRACLG
jgi:UDPglucose--hexose-1-phosphate uridylyltransferase